MKCDNCSSKLETPAVADPQIDFITILCGSCKTLTQKSLTRELEKSDSNV